MGYLEQVVTEGLVLAAVEVLPGGLTGQPLPTAEIMAATAVIPMEVLAAAAGVALAEMTTVSTIRAVLRLVAAEEADRAGLMQQLPPVEQRALTSAGQWIPANTMPSMSKAAMAAAAVDRHGTTAAAAVPAAA